MIRAIATAAFALTAFAASGPALADEGLTCWYDYYKNYSYWSSGKYNNFHTGSAYQISNNYGDQDNYVLIVDDSELTFSDGYYTFGEEERPPPCPVDLRELAISDETSVAEEECIGSGHSGAGPEGCA